MPNLNHLFEWHLLQQENRKIALTKSQTATMKKVIEEIKTDLDRLNMAYDHHGRLSLADVRPTGFLLKKRA